MPMFKTTAKQTQQPQTLKKKLMSALAMFLVATTLMTTTSYAWFVLSTAPEVTGIATNVGANGSLEIALLNAETYQDLSLIRAGAGTSMVSNNPSANNTWGNLVDLGYQEYGLSNLTLLPARLMVTGSEEAGFTVKTNLLAVPTYGFDGRVIELDEGTFSAVYQNSEFVYTGNQDYGVRAIGTSETGTAQSSALGIAKAQIPASIKRARNTTSGSLNESLLGLVVTKAMGGTYTDSDKKALNSMIGSLQDALDTIDYALRQGLIAYAASEIGNEDTFTTVKNRIDAAEDLSALLNDMTEVTVVPGTFATWVGKLSDMQNALNRSSNALASMTGGSYTWDQVSAVLNPLLNMNEIYTADDRAFINIPVNELQGMLGGDPIQLTLKPGAGIYADVADFTGNYTTNEMAYSFMGARVSAYVTTVSEVNPSYLNVMDEEIQSKEAAGGGEEVTEMPLDNTYGYAIDMAFRCNAADPDLVLQTSAIQRVYSDSESGSTQGGGSYMAFSSQDADFTRDQMLALMDALRVAFVDDQGSILSVAKLNITSATTEDGMTKAPLYLYDFTFEPGEDGGLLVSFGERLREDNVITDLQQNVAKAVTAVVWLDGDIVDNTMVSATVAESLNGVMNLQFATNAQLVPANDDDVKNWIANAEIKTLMNTALDPANEIGAAYAAGQGTWTTASWNAFAAAYERLDALSAEANPGEIQIRNAANDLAAAYVALVNVSKAAINEQVTQLRNEMGTSQDVSGYIVNGELITEWDGTEEWFGDATKATPVYGVDYMNNNLDGGEGAQTPKYSDESWNNVANALYKAEMVAGKADATDEEVDAALTELETAKKALTYQVAFMPYEYKETIYYKTAYDADVDDVYGDWYDSSFNRIYSEVLMLNLNAYAVPATLVNVNGTAYMQNDVDTITLDVSFLESVYPELRDARVKGVGWTGIDSNFFTAMMSSNHQIILQDLVASAPAGVDTTTASNLISSFTGGTKPTADEANAEIVSLSAKINAANAEEGYAPDNFYRIPGGNAEDIVYGQYTDLTLKYNGAMGKTTITAVILTEDGVVSKVTKEITIYDKADGLTASTESVTVEEGKTFELSVELMYTLDPTVSETISSYTWASDDTTTATVASDGTVTGVKAGSTTISVSVVTKEGNTYVIENIPVTVTAVTPAP